MAFELAKLLASQQYLTESLIYLSKAVELSEGMLQSDIGNEKLAEYYIHRAMVYEALGLLEMSRRDMLRIKQCDPLFRQKYISESMKLQREGNMQASFKIQ